MDAETCVRRHGSCGVLADADAETGIWKDGFRSVAAAANLALT